MDWRKITSEYFEKFEESAGVPFDGFPDEDTEREYLQTLQTCIDTEQPLTNEQRKRFFPSEFEETDPDTVI